MKQSGRREKRSPDIEGHLATRNLVDRIRQELVESGDLRYGIVNESAWCSPLSIHGLGFCYEA